MNPLIMATSRKRVLSGTNRRARNANLNSNLNKRSASALGGVRDSMPISLATNSDYMKKTGFVEFMKSNYENNTKKKLAQNVASTYKSVEDYHEESIVLKAKLQDLSVENGILKMKMRKADDDLVKRQKTLDEFMSRPSRCSSSLALAPNGSNLDHSAIINNLQIKLFKVEAKFHEKDKQLQELNKQLKTTRMKEMKVAMETLEKELARQKSLNENRDNKDSKDGEKDGDLKKKMKELTTTIVRMSEEKTKLLLENQSMRAEMLRLLEMRSKSKRQLEEMMKEKENVEKRGLSEIGGVSGEDLKRELNVLMMKVREKEGAIEEMVVNERKLKAENDQLSRNVSELKRENETVNKQYENLKRTHKELQDKQHLHKGRSDDDTDSDNDALGKRRLSSSRRASIVRSSSLKKGSSEKKVAEWPGSHEEAVEFVQAVVRNHNEKIRGLYGVNRKEERGGGYDDDDDADSMVEAIEMVQELVRFQVNGSSFQEKRVEH